MKTKTKKPALRIAPATDKSAPRKGMPEILDTPEFKKAWFGWKQFLTERGIGLSTEEAKNQLDLLAKLGPTEAIASIERNMANHPLKDRKPEPMAAAAKVDKPDAKEKKAAPASDKKAKAPPAAKAAKEPTQKPRTKPAGDTVAKERKPSALSAAHRVLTEEKKPMTCPELIEVMAKKGYWTSPGGKTPAATLYAAIVREISGKGAESRFKKEEAGKFAAK